MLTSSHPRHAEGRTASLATDRRRRRMPGGAVALLAAALLLLPVAGWAQQKVLVLSMRTVEVAESDSAGGTVIGTYDVHLSTKPEGTVTVEVASSDSDIASVDKEAIVFTPNNWSSSQSIIVTGKDDQVDNTGGGRMVTITNKADGYGTADVYVTVMNDVDAAGLIVNPNDTSTTPIRVTESGNEPGANGIGNEASYTVKLDTKPEGDVTVAVSSKDTRIATVSPPSLTFTVSNWEIEQPITVTGMDNDSGSPAEKRPVDITNTPSGGGYDSVEQVTVKVNVEDVGRDDVIGVTFEPREVKVKEGGQDTYSMRLNTNPGRSVTVTFQDDPRSNITLRPPSLTFTSSNWRNPQTVTVTSLPNDKVNDATIDDASDSITIAHDIKNYAGLSEQPPVTVKIIDDDKAGVTISPQSVKVPENGGEITYSVVLDSEPTGSVEVTPSSSDTDAATVSSALTFTTGNWNIPRTVTVTGVDDRVDNPGGSRRVTIANSVGSSGGDSNYGADELEEPSVSVAVTNVGDTAGLEFSGFTSNTPDTGNITYDLSLKTIPTSPGATLTLTSSDPAVTVSHGGPPSISGTPPNTLPGPVTVTVDVADDVENHRESRKVTITHKLSGGGYDAISATKTITISDSEKDPERGFNIQRTLTVDEASSSTPGYGLNDYTVKLDPALSDGDSSVTVTVISNSGYVRIAKSKLDDLSTSQDETFTFTASTNSHKVYVYGVNDDVDNGNDGRTATIRHEVPGGDYVPKEVKVRVRNQGDGAELTLTETSIDVDENGGTTTYVVGIGSAPGDAPVKVYVISSAPDTAKVTAAGNSNNDNNLELTFASADTEHTITVTGVFDDIDNGGSRTVYITHTPGGSGNYDSVSPKTLTVKVSDDDDAGLEVNADSFDMTEGGTASYTVRPKTEPTLGEAITVRIASQNAAVATARPAELKFTGANWNTKQSIKVTAVGAGSTKITNTPSGRGYGSAQREDVAVTVSELKAKGLRVDPSEVTVGEGATRTYTVRLRDDPDGPVTVGIASSNTSIATVRPAELMFTKGDWKTPQTVTVTGVSDSKVNSGGRSAAITHTASGGGYDTVSEVAVSVTVTDDDAAVTVSPTSVTVPEAGGRATYTMKLDGQPTGTVTVTVTSSTSAATVSPGSLTFTPSNWSTPQTVTVTGVDDSSPGDSRSATITHSASGGGYDAVKVPSVSVSVTDDDGMVVSQEAVPVAEAGGTATYTVRLRTTPASNVIVTVSSSDERIARASPSTLTFTSSNSGTAQTVTVTGVNDDRDNGASRSARITNTPSGAGYSSDNSIHVAVTVTDDDDAPTLEIRGGEATEGNAGTTRLTFAVTKSGATDQVVTVDYADAGTGTATAGTDYTAVTAGTLTFAPNETSKTITVMVRGDVVSEPDETIVIALSNPLNATFPGGETTVMATGTIIDDDASRLSIEAGAAEPVVEGKPLIFTVSLDPPIDDQQVTVEVDTGGTATAGTDYMGVPETLTFAAGEAAKTITVEVVDDADYELDETVEVELRNPKPSGDVVIETGEAMAMVTIEDNDAPPALSISGMSVAEGNAGTTSKLTFRVTKSGGTSMAATVAYEDAETGTATAGTDYTAVTAGTLTFAPKETSKTITVVVKGDDESEGNETVVIALSSLSNATIAEGKGSGTIIDDDTLPRVATDWLARFGRTAAGATLDAIARRMNDGPAAEPSLTVAGHRAAFAPEPVGHGAAATAAPWEEGWTRALTIEDLANGSSFDAGADFVEGLNVWAATSYNQFEMTPQGTYTMDGSLMSAILGVDHQGDTHVVGLALAYHGGGGDFGGIGKTEGSLGTNLYSVHPYVRLTFGEVFHVGGSFGLGTGDLSITDKDGDALVETGVGMPVLAAVDARMELSLAEAWLLALQADGHLVQMVADERLPRFTRVETNTHRLRLGVENSYAFLITDGVSLAPVLETGLRYDGGDAVETGLGFDIGGGLRLDATGAAGLMVDARGHVSLNNWGEGQEQAPALRDWGLGGVIRWRPDFGGHGPEVTLAPSYGAAAGGLNPGAIPSLDAEVGYRLPAFGGVLTPYSSAEFAGSGQRSYRAGAHLEFGHAVEVSAEGTYQQSATGDAEQFLTLRARLRQ